MPHTDTSTRNESGRVSIETGFRLHRIVPGARTGASAIATQNALSRFVSEPEKEAMFDPFARGIMLFVRGSVAEVRSNPDFAERIRQRAGITQKNEHDASFAQRTVSKLLGISRAEFGIDADSFDTARIHERMKEVDPEATRPLVTSVFHRISDLAEIGLVEVVVDRPPASGFRAIKLSARGEFLLRSIEQGTLQKEVR